MGWVIQNDELTNTEFIDMPQRPFVGNGPYVMWRINASYNNGMPYSPLMIERPPAPVQSVSNIYLGDQQISNIYLGGSLIIKMYCGDQIIYDNS